MMATKQIFIFVLCNGCCGIWHNKEGEHPLIEAAIYTKIPGLAFHKTLREPAMHEEGNWSVTHVKSGYRVSSLLSTRRQCMEYIKRIKDLIDWDQEEQSIRLSYENLSEADRRIILHGD